MKKILYLFLLLLPVLGLAQSRYGVEGVPMCWTTALGVDSSIIRYVLVSTTGQPVKTIVHENASGVVVNVSGGTLRYGFCDCAGGLDSLANGSVTWAKLANPVKDSINKSVTWSRLAAPVKDSIRIGMNQKRDTSINFVGDYNLSTAVGDDKIQRLYRKITLDGNGPGSKVILTLPDGGLNMTDVDLTVVASDDTIQVQAAVNDGIYPKFRKVNPNRINEYKCVQIGAGVLWKGSVWDSLGVGGTQLNTPTLSAVAVSNSELSLSWAAITGADKYILERSTNVGFSSSYVVYEGSLNYWVNQGLSAGTTYYYRVRAEGLGYVTSNNSSIVNATTQSAFNPNLSGQVVFWDITDTTTTRISGEISGINDQGSGNNDVPDLTPNRPNYFATGGPQNYPYVRTTTAEPLGVATFSEAATPLTIYAVVRLNDFSSSAYTVWEYNTLPVPGQTSSNGVKMRRDGTNRINNDARLYTQTGVGAYYGRSVNAAYRKEWMVIKIVLKDSNSHWIEINDEPVQYPKDSTGGAALAITRFLFYNCDIAQVRGFNRILTGDEDRKMKAYLVRHFGIIKPKVLGMHFGDSQTAGGGNTPRTYGPWATIVHDNSPAVFYNLGISGTRVDNSFDTLSLKYAKPEYADMWVTIQYGTNDAQQWTGDWENWKQLYKSIIQRFLNAGFKHEKIILLSLPYTSLTSYVGQAQPFVLSKTQEIAKELDIQFFDWNTAMKSVGSDVKTEPSTDGIHPGTSGHLIAGRGVLNILRGNTEEGLVPPQMDSVARKAIVFPQFGSIVHDTTYDALYMFTGDWVKIGATTGGGGGGSYFPADGGALTGTGGAGFLGLRPQTSHPSTPATGVNMFANSVGDLSWRQSNGFVNSFVRSSSTADRTYTLPDVNGTIPIQSGSILQDAVLIGNSGGQLTTNSLLKYTGATLEINQSNAAIRSGYATLGQLASAEYGAVGTNYRNNGSGVIRQFADGGSAIGFGGSAGGMAMTYWLWGTGAANSSISRNTVLYNTSNASMNYMKWGFNIGANAPSADYHLRGIGTTGNLLRFENSAQEAVLTSTNDKKVGINITTPLATLDVRGDCIITSTIWLDAAKTIGIFTGTGSPESVVTASVGSVFHRTTDGGAGTSFYVKESGSGATGWVAK